MANRSIRLSQQGRSKVRQGLNLKGWRQQDLKDATGLGHQAVSHCLNGKPVDRSTVDKIYPALNLSWEEGDAEPDDAEPDIDTLVQEVRQKRRAKIQEQCGKMRMLDIEQPIDTTEIYTDVNILEKITSRQWREIPDLLKNFNPESDDFDRLGLSRREKRVPGLEAVKRYSKLMVLGKPGAGKTTFLKWLAVKCNLGELLPRLIPIFITLKDFAKDSRKKTEFNLFNYIKEEFRYSDISDEPVINTLLLKGHFLILLDGLDEVPEADEDEVIDEIRKFSEKSYFQNHFIITCRIAAGKYSFSEENFKVVEVADFDSEQVETFVKNWFIVVASNNRQEGEATAQRFIEKLNLPENQSIRELTITPILLNLACFVFKEKDELPSKRSKLYKDGLDILLVRWDEERRVKRDEVYQNLSKTNKLKMLSQLATITFERGDYFFEVSKVPQIIPNYISTSSELETDQESLRYKSEVLLKSIAAQHGLLVERARGIYSFSHLTFQEYFTAKYYIDNSGSDNWEKLLSNITNKAWREVFLLVIEISNNPDKAKLLLLMKQKIDSLVTSDSKLNEVIAWLKQKCDLVQTNYKPASVRAFYLALILDVDIALNRAITFARFLDHPILTRCLEFALSRTNDLPLTPMNPNTSKFNLLGQIVSITHGSNLDINLEQDLALARTLDLAFACNPKADRALNLVLTIVTDRKLRKIIQQLKDQIPTSSENEDKLKQWWQDNGKTWAEKLRLVMIEHRRIGHNWQFSEQQKKALEQYYNANKLLLDCLNSSDKVSHEIREQIEKSLFIVT